MVEKTIFYHDTDAGGVVYYANYLKFLEEARTVFFVSRGVPMTLFKERGLFFVVRSCSLTYRAPARYGEVLLINAQCVRASGVQLFFVQNVINKNTDQIIVTADVTLACLDKDFKPCPLPVDIRKNVL